MSVIHPAITLILLSLASNCCSIQVEVILPNARDTSTTSPTTEQIQSRDTRTSPNGLDIGKDHVPIVIVENEEKTPTKVRDLVISPHGGSSSVEVRLPSAPAVGMVPPEPTTDNEVLPRTENEIKRSVKENPLKLFLIAELPSVEKKSMEVRGGIDQSGGHGMPSGIDEYVSREQQRSPLYKERLFESKWYTGTTMKGVDGSSDGGTDQSIGSTTDSVLENEHRMTTRNVKTLIRVKETVFNDIKEIDHYPDSSMNPHGSEGNLIVARDTDPEDPKVLNYEKERTEVKNLKLTDVKMLPASKREIENQLDNSSKSKSGPFNVLTAIGILLLLMMLVLIVIFGVWMYTVSSNRQSDDNTPIDQEQDISVDIEEPSPSTSSEVRKDAEGGTSIHVTMDSDSTLNISTDTEDGRVSKDSELPRSIFDESSRKIFDDSPNGNSKRYVQIASPDRLASYESKEFETLVNINIEDNQESIADEDVQKLDEDFEKSIQEFLDLSEKKNSLKNSKDDFNGYVQSEKSSDSMKKSHDTSSKDSMSDRSTLGSSRFPKRCRKKISVSESESGNTNGFYKTDHRATDDQANGSEDLRTLIRRIPLRIENPTVARSVSPDSSSSSLHNIISSKWASEDEDEDVEKYLDEDRQALSEAVRIASYLQFEDESNPPSEVFEVCRDWIEDKPHPKQRLNVPRQFDKQDSETKSSVMTS